MNEKGTLFTRDFTLVVLSLIGGVLADRVNKRNIMVGLDFCTAILILAFYLSLGKMPTVPLFIIILMLLYGISGTYQPAVQASIPLLVAPEKLMAGNAVINQVNTLSGLLGPVIGGAMFGMWGIYPILVLSIVCFTLSAVMEVFISIPHEKRVCETGIFAIVRGDLKESYHFVKTEKPIFFSVVFLVSIFNLVLSAAMGIALFLNLPAILSYWVITSMSFLAMGTSTLFVVQIYTMVQTQTPRRLVGKIMAVLIGAAFAAFIISLYSKRIFSQLE